jgi:exosortase
MDRASVLSETPLSKAAIWSISLSAVAIGLVIAGLYGFFPYSAGYNEARVSIISFASGMWKLEDWQHCGIVPIAAAGLIFLQRKKLAAIPISGSWLGLPVVLLALMIFWFGYQADIVYFGYVSMQVMLAGLIIFLFGWSWMLALAFPWLFLLFMWPLLFLDNIVAFPLRLAMSHGSVAALNILGLPSVLSGTGILSAPDALTGKSIGALFSVDVADPCSGIRSLFALMMVSALYGHFSVEGWWRKWILFLGSIPLAVIGNLFRILILTFGTVAFGPEVAIGTLKDPSFFHMLAGYVVYAVAIGGMLGISWLLNANWPSLLARLKTSASQSVRPAAPKPATQPPGDLY